MAYRLGCDVGGTFTDFVLYDEAGSAIHVEKHLTTPQDPAVGILEGLRAFERVDPEHVTQTGRICHATTLIANAVIERKGARTALLTTRGFRDVLELRRHVRVTTYELWSDPPPPLVPRPLRIPIEERTYSDGKVLQPVAPDDIAAAVEQMHEAKVESVAIASTRTAIPRTSGWRESCWPSSRRRWRSPSRRTCTLRSKSTSAPAPPWSTRMSSHWPRATWATWNEGSPRPDTRRRCR